MADDAGTATLESPATPAPDSDGGTAVQVAESPADAARTEFRTPETFEQKQTREKAAFDQVMADRDSQARGKDGKFSSTAGKIPLAKDPGDEDPSQSDDPKPKDDADTAKEPADAADTPEQREKLVVARRALRRDGFSDEEISLFPADKLLAIGAKRADMQARVDERFAQLAQGKPGDQGLPPTNGEVEQAPEAPAGVLPAEVLGYLPEEDQKKVTDSVARYIQQATKAAEFTANKARLDLRLDRALSIQQELSADYPSLKGERPPPEFEAKVERLAASGQYQLDTREGIKELLSDAALVTYGKQIKQEVQQSMIQRNRAALAGQPDPKTLTAPTRKGTVTKAEADKIAFDVAHSGLKAHEIQPEYHKRLAGRQIIG